MKPHSEKVSICITYYNQQEYVRQSLDSVLAIDFPCDFEILCGDDGSSDGTINILEEYSQKYPDIIKYYIWDRTESAKTINRASLNRLNLASRAVGDYIIFLDGDDYYCDTLFVKEAVDILNKHKDVEVCAFNFRLLQEDKSESTFKQGMQGGILSASDYIAKGVYTPSGTCVFRNRLTMDRLKLLRKINNFDDNAITIYMLQFGNIYYINKPIYVYRQLACSLWNSISDIEKVLINAFDYKLICDTAPMLRRELLRRFYGGLRYLYRHRRQLAEYLGDGYEKYEGIARNNEDVFISNLLHWNELNLATKLKTMWNWLHIKIAKRL